MSILFKVSKTLKTATWVGLGVFFLYTPPTQAGPYAGAQFHVPNFFILPGGTGLSTKSNVGLGTIFAGINVGGILGVDAFVAKDNTGTISGTGTLFGSTGTFSGKFKVLSYGVEARLDPPIIPIFLKLGVGLGDIDSEVTLNGTSSPFSALQVAYLGHFGVGFSLGLPLIKLFGGLDAVYVKIKSSSTSATANLSSFVYFRGNIGAMLSL